ncbi:HIT family protein [Dermacoccaceae bacterium W4C1]
MADAGTCAFCAIVAGQQEAHVVLRTDNFTAFLDRVPVIKGHVLLVPNAHHETLPDLPAQLAPEWVELQQRLVRAVMQGLGAQGAFVANNNIVSQSVPHLHQHVIPRTKRDGLVGFFWPRRKYATGEAADYARRIADAL